MKPEDRKRLKQHIEMIVEHKTPIEELEDMIRKLRLELHTLRFKESQEQRFIWWIWNVYSRNVNDLIYDIMGATTYDTEGEAKEGKYALPKRCFDLMKRIDEYTEHIYDGTYLDTAMSTEQSNSDVSVTQDVLTDIKTGQSIEKETCSWIQEDDPDICYWKTGCGNSFYFTEGTPTDNNMKYCCYCGKLLKQEE
jgi:hypothetical protein